MEEKKVQILDFIRDYKLATNKDNIFKTIEIKQYVNYMSKVGVCERIKNASCVKMNDKGEIESVCVNSPAKHILFILNIISLYTSLEIDFNKMVDTYDALDECGLIEVILSYIPKKEVESMQVIMEMTMDDLMTNYYENKAWVSRELTNLSSTLPSLLKVMNTKVDNKTDGKE